MPLCVVCFIYRLSLYIASSIVSVRAERFFLCWMAHCFGVYCVGAGRDCVATVVLCVHTLLYLSLNVWKSVRLPPYTFFSPLRNYWKNGFFIHPTVQICCLWFQKLSASIRRYPIIPLQYPYLSLMCLDLPPKIPLGHIICFMVRGLHN
jgi:hypothetical protein